MSAPAPEKTAIAFDDIGAGEPAVVLLHGLFSNRTYYAAQADHLAKHHRVLSIDFRGHGESAVPDAGYSLQALADDVIRVCDEVGVRRAVFCGHSMPVALKVVVTRPDLAAGLVLLDGAVLMPESERARLAGFWSETLATNGWRDALVGFFCGVAGAVAERVGTDIAAAPRVYAAPMLGDIMSSDYAAELVAVRCPIMYVHGRIPADLDRLRALRPDAIVETIPDAGHYVMLTAPDQVNAALDRFLVTVG